MTVRLGAVGYLNARPLVFGLENQSDYFSVRFDVPSRCAALLEEGATDLGLIPSIEYCRNPDYRIVPGAAVASHGPVDSVALFLRGDIRNAQSVALDNSSRTSVALVKVLCARHFGIAPRFETMAPDIGVMLDRCDAALVIGDPALFLDAPALGLTKIDLGQTWTQFTGLPFVWAFWAGRVGSASGETVMRLQQARRDGEVGIRRIAERHAEGDPARTERIDRYLRENIKYDLDGPFERGLGLFYQMAGELGLVPAGVQPRLYESSASVQVAE